MSLFVQVLKVLEQSTEVVESTDKAALIDCGPVDIMVGKADDQEVCLRWYYQVEEEFTTEYRRRKVAQLLMEQTGLLRTTRAAQRRSAWFVDPRTGALGLDHLFCGEPEEIMLAVKWMVMEVVAFLPVLIWRLYGAKNWEALQARRAAELEEQQRVESAVAQTVNNLPISEDPNDQDGAEGGKHDGR